MNINEREISAQTHEFVVVNYDKIKCTAWNKPAKVKAVEENVWRTEIYETLTLKGLI